jgi:hypothetical protein
MLNKKEMICMNFLQEAQDSLLLTTLCIKTKVSIRMQND